MGPSTVGSSGKTSLDAGKDTLIAIAEKANPTIKFWDPLGLAEQDFWEAGNEATIGFLRHAEIKHGRVAMAAFVGYIIQSNVVFTWPQNYAGDLPPSTDLLPEEQWDAIPLAARYQIIAVIGFLEFWDEIRIRCGCSLHAW